MTNRVHYVDMKIKQFTNGETFKRDVEMRIIKKQSIHLEDIHIEKKMSMGGYAFAED